MILPLAGPPASSPGAGFEKAVPIEVELPFENSAEPGSFTNDPWNLFDGDTERAFVSPGGSTLRLRLTLEEPRAITGFSSFGNADGLLTVLAESDGRLRPIPGLDQLDLAGRSDSWQQFNSAELVRARSLILEWQPFSTEASLQEIELWATASSSPRRLGGTFDNVTRFEDLRDEGSEDDVVATTTYHVNLALYVAKPELLVVRDARGRLLRQRRATYDHLGHLVRLEQTLQGGHDPETGAAWSGSRNPTWSFSYDTFGNLAVATDPKGFSSQLSYDRDPRRAHVTGIVDSLGYSSRFAYHERYGYLEGTTDKNGNSITWEFDGFGRPVEVASPYDAGSSPTVAMEYHPEANPPWARTRHKDVTRSDPIDTVIFIDGEELAYGFDAGGRVKSVTGQLRGISYEYLRHLGYDEFGDRVRLVYGNGVETRFTHDSRSRFLANLRTVELGGREIQDLRYNYDQVGTILSFANDVPLPRPSQMGGPTVETFRYDDLYQLVHAEGSYRFPPNKETTYELSLAYDETGNVLTKSQTHLRIQPSGKGILQKKTSYDWRYEYGGLQPHAATHFGERSFHYDLNGNQTGWDHDRTGQRRTITWNEENRIQAVADNGRTTRFLYDAAGTRTNKAGPHGETIYVSAFFSVRNGAIGSKHVFADGRRVATKLALQSLNASPPGPGPEEQKRYFYHGDHLGSAHFVTDDGGEVYQHLEYFPTGELWVAERSESQRTPYLFSGKELDEETGLSYFGFRYYEPRQGQWLSPDPIFDGMLDTDLLETSDLSVLPYRQPGQMYAYTANDPINLMDPAGLKEVRPSEILRLGSGNRARLKKPVPLIGRNAERRRRYRCQSAPRWLCSPRFT